MTLTDDERYQLGVQLGDTIVALFAAIAKLDGVTLQQAMDTWTAAYFAERVTQDR